MDAHPEALPINLDAAHYLCGWLEMLGMCF
jgi:hypothetical protein